MAKKTKIRRKLDKDTRQLIGILVVIAVIFISFLVPYLYSQSLKKFDFLGVDWSIEKSGGLTLYHTRVPKVYNGEVYGYHNIYLRNDPRKNSVPANVNVSFFPRVRISQEPEVFECKNQVVVMADLGQITRLFPFIKDVEGAVADKGRAEEWVLPFADCESEKDKDTTVFLIEMGEESSVTQRGENCYVMTMDSCEDNLAVYERFVIEIVDQLNFEKK